MKWFVLGGVVVLTIRWAYWAWWVNGSPPWVSYRRA